MNFNMQSYFPMVLFYICTYLFMSKAEKSHNKTNDIYAKSIHCTCQIMVEKLPILRLQYLLRYRFEFL